ncbi:MAG TPA: efflux RND transporter permease subunit [Gemmatimonadaceae bacterium]|nr:efflux RND transporter permease subunit [Gemmatimonadaceae bacterium]
MRLTALFIRRPVMTTLLMIGILVFGIIGYRQLPVSDLPTVDYPALNVNANLPGASPETMAATVATPLEKAFSAIAGIDEITSNSSLGSTNITLTFALDRDIESAAQDVNAAISKTLAFLPPNILPPSYRKNNPSAAPILNIALTSTELSVQAIDEYAETTIAQRLSMITGVAQVNVFGSAKYAVRVQLDPSKLASLGIGVSQVAAQIRNNNVMLPTGVLYGRDKTLTIQATGQMSNAAEFRRLIVAYKNGAPVRLGDLGQVLDDIQNNKNAAFYNGERTINLFINRQPGTNTVAIATAVKKELAEIEKGLPPNLSVHLQFDRSASIQRSVDDVKRSLVIALCLVVMVIFVFLRNVVATLIPSLTLPMAIVGTFSVMAMLSFSIDNLSLMALTLAVGFLVDDAIVMLENIYRHLEMGKPPLKAALDGANEIGYTIFSMTLSLASVFIPLAFMGGIIGRLFREFAITIMVAVLVSGFVSLTLTPMLCSRLLKAHADMKHGKWFTATERVFERARGAYERSLGGLMRHRWLALVFSALILALTAALWTTIPKGLFPPDDTGSLNGTLESAQGTSFQDMLRFQRIAMDRLKGDTNIASYTSSVGGGFNSSNQMQLNVTLKPLGQRPSADQMVVELTRRFAGIPGLTAFFTNPPSIQIGGRGSKTQYQFTLRASDIKLLYAEASRLQQRLQQEPMLSGVTSNLLNTAPIVRVHIDRQRALALGVSPSVIENALANAYNQQQVSTIYTPTNEYWVVMETVPSAQLDASALERFYVPGRGRMIPLTDVARFERTLGPLSIPHSGQMASVTISFNLAPGASLGAAVAQVNKIAGSTLPASISTGFSGTAQAFQASQQGLGILLLITVFIIYLILGVLYESFVHPVTILTGLPFAAFGALAALYLARVELGVYGYVGIVMLIGIVQKNAIMMIDFAIARERENNVPPAEAIMQAASVRFRPIMMTTFSAIMGTLPIAIGVGASAASRRPLGIAVVGGLVFSQVVTLYVTPVFYTYLDELQGWLGRLFTRRARAGRPAPELAHATVAATS